MKVSIPVFKHRFLVLIMLVLSSALLAQSTPENALNTQPSQELINKRIERLKERYPERLAKMNETDLQMFRENELRMMQRENLKTDNGEMMQPKGGSNNSHVNVNDSLALVAIYNATDGPNWNSKSNWLTGPVNSWFGITVSNGFVIEIMLEGNNLQGTIPAEIGNLTNLQYLYFWNNHLSSIPSEIGNLTNLQNLILGNNQLSNIPPEIGNLNNLYWFELNNNQLSSIPPEIGNLSHLGELNFSGNLLSSIPVELWNLHNLYKLVISSNLFNDTIPIEICDMEYLGEFFFEDNYFDLGSCPALTCLKQKGVFLYLGTQLNGYDLYIDCGFGPTIDIGLDNDSICADNTSYYFSNTTATNVSYFRWFTINGGGYFENEYSLHPTYYPSPAIDYTQDSIIIGVEVVGDYYGDDRFQDYMNLYFLSPPQATAGEDANIDAGNNYYLINANALFYSSIAWTTSGDGTFSNPAEQNPVYTPGNADISNGQVQLCLNVFSNICPPASSCMNLHIQQIQNNSDSLALVALYNATNGSNWTNKTNWLTGPLNTWYGITVTESFVTKIVLYNNNLIGFFPPEIWNLTNLVTLSLGENHISGNIPVEVGNMANLQELVIWGNQLTGSIPAEVGNLTYLKMIQLSNNQLSGSIPSSISNLTNLERLILDYNQLTGIIPGEIGNLSSLWDLSLSHNNLLGIPDEIGNLSNLQWFRASNNQLSGSVPTSIGNLLNLKSLDLSENQLTGSIPVEICNIPMLDWFELFNNYFDLGSCPAIVCLIDKGVDITNGVQLNGNNLLSCITTELSIEIGVDYDQICMNNSSYNFGFASASIYESIQWTTTNGTGSFSDPYILHPSYYPSLNDFLQGSVWIKAEVYRNSVYVSDSMVLGFVPGPEAFAGNDDTILTGQSYFLNGAFANNYSSINWQTSGDGFFDFVSMTNPAYNPGYGDIANGYVQLCMTAQPNPMPIPPCPSATSCMNLTIQQTQINTDSLALVALYNATNGPNWTNKTNWLTGPLNTWSGIYLSNGRVTGVYLYNNNLVGVIPAEIGNLSNIQNLRLDYNQLNSIPPEIGNLTNLQYLTLSNNQLSSIPSEIGNLTSLEQLFLDNNQLSSICPEIGDLTNLIRLCLNNNQIIAIPPEIGNLTNLSELYLNNNQITNIPPEIGNLSSLWVLYLDNNQINALPPEIGNLQNLFYLFLNNNLISTIPPEIGNLSGLSDLNLSYNQISTIPEELKNMNTIYRLYLSHNLIGGNIPPEIWNNYLSILDLSYNQLTGSIPNGIYASYLLDLSNNNLSGTIPVEICTIANLTEFSFHNNYFDLESCPTVFCLLNKGVNIPSGIQLNGLDLLNDCLPTLIDIVKDEDSICSDGSGYYFENVIAQNYYYIEWWTTEGTGYFDDIYTVNPTYFPSPDDYIQGKVTIKVWVQGEYGEPEDFMILNFENPPEVSAGPDVSINSGNYYTLLDAIATNYASLSWESSGDGTFNDAHLLRSTYFPGINDFENLCVNLTITAFPNEDCSWLNANDTVQLFFEKLVSNVTANQRDDGSKIVDVFYDVNSQESELNIEAEWSIDNGLTILPFVMAVGDVGDSISSGMNKHIVWNAGNDASDISYDSTIFKITANPYQWQCGDTLFDTRDNQIYTTVRLGTQCWMAENLNFGTMINGTGDQTNNGTIEKYCYNNSESNCDVYGGLYQWNEIMQYSTLPGVKGICPPINGWHLPTDEEWTLLTTFLGDQYVAGGKMKETGTIHWYPPNSGATNSSFFTALPGGRRNGDDDGRFGSLGYYGFWWSSTQLTSSRAWPRYLSFGAYNISRYSEDKSYSLSVRCLIPINLPPANPESPSPASGSLSNPLNMILSWNCSDPEKDLITYDVYFGTENPPEMVSPSQIEITFNPGLLVFNTTYYWKIIAHDNHENISEGPVWNFKTALSSWNCNQSITITHSAGSVAPVDKTVSYNIVTNIPGEPFKCWITSNLGAEHQAISVDDTTEASAGWYWQFNRKQGYKLNGYIRIPNTGWIYPITENDGWQFANDPCTIELGVGWRIPTNTEWTNVDVSGNWTNWNGPWNSDLKLHAAGRLFGDTGSLYSRGNYGSYWSSSTYNTTYGMYLGFLSDQSNTGGAPKSTGFSIRCILGL